jgi:hypothetical protein
VREPNLDRSQAPVWAPPAQDYPHPPVPECRIRSCRASQAGCPVPWPSCSVRLSRSRRPRTPEPCNPVAIRGALVEPHRRCSIGKPNLAYAKRKPTGSAAELVAIGCPDACDTSEKSSVFWAGGSSVSLNNARIQRATSADWCGRSDGPACRCEDRPRRSLHSLLDDR